MRVDLKVPFAEKDAAKAAGARWDRNCKVWYVVDAPDLSKFTAWLPDVPEGHITQGAPGRSPARPQKAEAPSITSTLPKESERASRVAVPACGCDVPPWEDCEHTVRR